MNTTDKKFVKKHIKVLAPATIANLVCGFDVLGMALNNPCDIMEISLSEKPGIRIQHNDIYNLPTKPEENVAGVSLIEMMQELDKNIGFDIVIEKHIKPGSGLGSSAASAAGIVVAANHLLGNIFSNEDLVRFAMSGYACALYFSTGYNFIKCPADVCCGGASPNRSKNI